MARMNRVQSKRATIELEKQAITELKKLINKIADEVGLDPDKVGRRVQTALKSEYGRVNGLVNLVSAISYWPAEAGDGASVNEARELIANKLQVDTMILEDIRNYRGYHTFASDELKIISGSEPDYENYADYCQIFLEDLGIKGFSKPTICKSKWTKLEVKAQEEAQLELDTLKAEVDAYKARVERQS